MAKKTKAEIEEKQIKRMLDLALSTGVHKSNIATYLEFCRWLATPRGFREKENLPEKRIDFVKRYKTDYDVLWKWENHAETWEIVKIFLRIWGMRRTANVLAALYRTAIKHGRRPEVELWLQYFAGFTPRQEHILTPGQELSEEEKKEIDKLFEENVQSKVRKKVKAEVRDAKRK